MTIALSAFFAATRQDRTRSRSLGFLRPRFPVHRWPFDDALAARSLRSCIALNWRKHAAALLSVVRRLSSF